MIRKIATWTLLALTYAACVPGSTTTVGFTSGVEGAPPPPPAVVAQPPVVSVTGGVYVVSDPAIQYDMFQYGSSWYVYSGGYWYRAPSYRGPFTVVDVRYVPRRVIEVPPGHWKNHPRGGPPGQARKHGDHGDRGRHGDHDD
ncbi:MAG TPA: hypothetical protein VFR85_01835 [Anaeromyxobacteraceae bacterium]|nr:hypothetical protein [Anaeromyxobacteraceae bacterium]